MHRFGATYGVQNEGWNMMEPETIRNTVFLVKQERAFFWGPIYLCGPENSGSCDPYTHGQLETRRCMLTTREVFLMGEQKKNRQ